jgi:hypothetical protein
LANAAEHHNLEIDETGRRDAKRKCNTPIFLLPLWPIAFDSYRLVCPLGEGELRKHRVAAIKSKREEEAMKRGEEEILWLAVNGVARCGGDEKE